MIPVDFSKLFFRHKLGINISFKNTIIFFFVSRESAYDPVPREGGGREGQGRRRRREAEQHEGAAGEEGGGGGGGGLERAGGVVAMTTDFPHDNDRNRIVKRK